MYSKRSGLAALAILMTLSFSVPAPALASPGGATGSLPGYLLYFLLAPYTLTREYAHELIYRHKHPGAKLSRAIEDSNVRKVEKLLDSGKFDINAEIPGPFSWQTDNLETPLERAVEALTYNEMQRCTDPRALRILEDVLNAGAKLTTPAMNTAIFIRCLEVTENLLAREPDFDLNQSVGSPPVFPLIAQYALNACEDSGGDWERSFAKRVANMTVAKAAVDYVKGATGCATSSLDQPADTQRKQAVLELLREHEARP